MIDRDLNMIYNEHTLQMPEMHAIYCETIPF